MDREDYINEVAARLSRMFRASKEGFKPPAADRHRLEGFMQAGVFLGLARHSELNALMNEIHTEVFGKSIEERRRESADSWPSEMIDYTAYEQPTYARKASRSERTA
jgi:hypothetical protein